MHKNKILKQVSIILVPVIIVMGLLADLILGHYQHWLLPLAHFATSFLLGALVVMLLTPVMIFLSRRTGVLDHPDSRKVHKNPMPLFGGLAIYLGFLGVSSLLFVLTPEMKSILAAASILLVLGTIDDMIGLSSVVRLLGQLAATFIIISSGLIVSFTPEVWWGNLLGGAVTIIWVLGITNALNFMDGMDGLAAGITMIAAMFFFLITMHLKEFHVAMMASLLMGCCAGFLFFNFRPARIYLGDGGSSFLGFMLAAMALYGGWSDRGPVIALGIPSLILGVLIFDMCYITISRIKNGYVRNVRQWLDHTGRDHFHHRLVHLGFKDEQAVIFIYIVCLSLGLGALLLHKARVVFPVAVLTAQAVLIFVNIVILMRVGRKLTIPRSGLAVQSKEDEAVFRQVEAIVKGSPGVSSYEEKAVPEGRADVREEAAAVKSGS
jgi:UDP-GlcNAc:undecaprenyl-phosphate GlcNAc-1-phosphate transferase